MSRHKKHHQGMTLIECLVALLIAGIVSVMLLSAMSHVMTMKRHRAHRLEQEQPIHDVFAMLQHDISTMLPQAVHWSSGDSSPIIDVGQHRWCWTSLGGRMQPDNSQVYPYRVCYSADNNELVRRVWVIRKNVAHDDVIVTHRWRHIHDVTFRWPSQLRSSDSTVFWPLVWEWQLDTDVGSWRGAARVVVWPRGGA